MSHRRSFSNARPEDDVLPNHVSKPNNSSLASSPEIPQNGHVSGVEDQLSKVDELDADTEMAEAQKLLNGYDAEKVEAVNERDVIGNSKPKPIPAVVIVPIWIGLSGGVILFNKHIFSDLNFPYPIFLTCFHMAVASVGTRLLQRAPVERLNPKKVDMSWETWWKTIFPLSALFSMSLMLSNIAYVHLSVSFVQMLKAFIPILTLVIQLVTRLQQYNHLLLFIICVTTLGCVTAAAGELRFSLFGFVCQCGAVIVESARLVLIQVLLQEYKMDPLTSIAMYAPVCVVMIGLVLPFMEGSAPLDAISNVGFLTFAANGAIAFALNVAGVFLIDSAGSLVLTLSGIFKDVLLILLSVLLMGSSIAGSQVLGYSVALTGLALFKLTGGNPATPNGQRLVRLISPILEVQASLTRLSPRRLYILALAAGVFFVIVASPIYIDSIPFTRTHGSGVGSVEEDPSVILPIDT